MVHIGKNISRIGVYGVATATLATAGFAGVASAGSQDTSGPWSRNIVSHDFSLDFTSRNNNNVEVKNETTQKAETGDAIVGGFGSFWGGNGHNNWYNNQWQNRDKHGHGDNFEGHKWYNQWGDWYQDNYWNKYQDKYDRHGKDYGYCNYHNKYDHDYKQHERDYGHGYKQANNHKDYDYDYGYDKDYGKQHYGYGGNTVGGDAATGDAHNEAYTDTAVNVVNRSNADNGGWWATGNGSAANGKIYLTGPGSYNVIRSDVNRNIQLVNNNNVEVENETEQEAETGDAIVAGNTIGGDARTGDAVNMASTETQVRLVNDTSAPNFGSNWGNSYGGASIGLTGPGSTNVIRYDSDFNYRQVNNNNVEVENETEQEAETGDAIVAGNTIGGDARTGDAVNRASTQTAVVIRNL